MSIELQRRRPPTEQVPSKGAVRLIAAFEGLSLKSYPDPATGGDPWTAGYGHTGPDVRPGMAITLKQADDWLAEDLEEAASIVRSNILVALTPGEFDALCSLAFNLGYLPRSLKACLNGGRTDKGEQMEPGSYGSALKQFPRNCRAAGIPMRGLLRRRLAEACVFSDLPWEAACSMNLIRLKFDAAGKIDPDETTSLEDTLERARQDVPMARPPIDVTKPWPMPAARDVAVAPAPLPDLAAQATIRTGEIDIPLPGEFVSEEEEQPAATVREPEAKGTELAQATQPTAQAPSPVSRVNETAKIEHDETVVLKIPPNLNTNTGVSKPASAGPDPIAPSPPVQPSPLPGPFPPKPPLPAPPSVQVNPTSDMGGTVKNMFRTKRFWGGALIVGGRIIIALDVTGTFAAPVRALIGDGILMDWMTGVIVTMIGEAVMARGEKTATAPMGTPKEVALYSIPPVKS